MFEVLTAAEIEKVRQVSRSKDRGPWVEWPERMWEKSAGRRLFSKLPLGERDSERILRVLEASSADEGGAAAALYGSEREQAAESLPRPAPASGDDPAPRSDEPDPEPEPVDAAAQVEVAGAMVIPTGNNKGKTIAEVGSAEKGHSWIKWCIKQRDHECSEAAGVWAKENLPALYQQAMGELETQEG
jgi:recombination protein RecT